MTQGDGEADKALLTIVTTAPVAAAPVPVIVAATSSVPMVIAAAATVPVIVTAPVIAAAGLVISAVVAAATPVIKFGALFAFVSPVHLELVSQECRAM